MSRHFKKAYIEISDICGLKCSFCPSIKGRRGKMDLGVFEKICSQLQGKCDVIDLHLLGDPLKNQDLFDYLEIASIFNHRVEIVTSGYYLKEWDFKKLLSPPIRQFNISLSAFSDVNNPKSRQYLHHCLEFAIFHQKHNMTCFVNLRMHKSRLNEEIAQFFCHALNVKYQFERDRIKLGEYLFLTLSKDFEWIDSANPHLKKEKFCYGLSAQIGFLADGRVVPCCIDCDGRIELGNIKQQNLNEILSSSLSQQILLGFQKGEAYHIECQRCTYSAQK